MKLQFNPDLDFQREAIDSITGIFKGQETCRTNFTVACRYLVVRNALRVKFRGSICRLSKERKSLPNYIFSKLEIGNIRSLNTIVDHNLL